MDKPPSDLLELIDSEAWSHCINPVCRLDMVMELADQMRSAKRFVPPTYDDVLQYAGPRAIVIDARKFVDFYTSKGWMVGKNKMKDWKAAVRNWGADYQKQPIPVVAPFVSKYKPDPSSRY